MIRIVLPSLRERVEDIPALTHHFLQAIAKELGVEAKVIAPETLQVLSTLSWPGNVRQLENICRWLTVMASSKEILPQDLPPDLLSNTRIDSSLQDHNTLDTSENPSLSSNSHTQWQLLFTQWVKQALKEGKENILPEVTYDIEKILLECALNFTRGHKQDAARILGWGRNTLTRKIKELNINTK